MKIIVRLSFLVLIPIMVGLVLILTGNSAGVYVLEIGTPSVMAVLIIAGLVLLMKGKLFPKATEENSGATSAPPEQTKDGGAVENETETTENVDATENGAAAAEQPETSKTQSSTSPIELGVHTNRYKFAEFEAEQITEGTKNASKVGVAVVVTCVILIIACVILATVFTIKQNWVGAIVCAALFALTIITTLITCVIRQALSMKGNIGKAKKLVRGKVKFSVLSSTAQSKRLRDPSVRVFNAVYRTVVRADDGDGEYEAFSNRHFEADETVVVAVLGKKLAKIVEGSDLADQSEEMKSNYEKCLSSGETVTIKRASSSVTAGNPHRHSHTRRH